MAKVIEKNVVIKLSQLVKGTDTGAIDTSELVANLEPIVQELVGSGIIVEVEEA